MARGPRFLRGPVPETALGSLGEKMPMALCGVDTGSRSRQKASGLKKYLEPRWSVGCGGRKQDKLGRKMVEGQGLHSMKPQALPPVCDVHHVHRCSPHGIGS